MLLDLFSVFDYNVFMGWTPWGPEKQKAMLWASALCFPGFICSWGTWMSGSKISLSTSAMAFKWAWGETPSKAPDMGASALLSATFMYVAFMALWQVTPGVMVGVSHISVTGSLAFTLWTTMLLASLFSSTNQILASLVPEGAPGSLIPALVIVEIFSHAMRPIALAARLSLTTMTGHIILGLTWGISSELTTSWLNTTSSDMWLEKSLCLALLNAGLILAEVAITLLQAYIFFTLLLFFATQYPVFSGSPK